MKYSFPCWLMNTNSWAQERTHTHTHTDDFGERETTMCLWTYHAVTSLCSPGNSDFLSRLALGRAHGCWEWASVCVTAVMKVKSHGFEWHCRNITPMRTTHLTIQSQGWFSLVPFSCFTQGYGYLYWSLMTWDLKRNNEREKQTETISEITPIHCSLH